MEAQSVLRGLHRHVLAGRASKFTSRARKRTDVGILLRALCNCTVLPVIPRNARRNDTAPFVIVNRSASERQIQSGRREQSN